MNQRMYKFFMITLFLSFRGEKFAWKRREIRLEDESLDGKCRWEAGPEGTDGARCSEVRVVKN